MRKVLLVPTWALFAVLGLLFAFAGRRRRRTNVFVN
jgi:MYXO-CTERM domain-containing protein